MTKGARRVQNRGVTRQWAVKGRLKRPKLQVEMQPFLASKAVIFGVNPTGPHILIVIFFALLGANGKRSFDCFPSHPRP